MKKSKVFSRHAFGVLTFHLVWCTKYRRTRFPEGSLRRINADKVFDALLCSSNSDNSPYIIREWSIMPDHVHMLIELAPSVALSDVIQGIKNHTAKDINKLNKERGHLWERGYFAESIGNRSVSRVTKYIQTQSSDPF